VRLDEDPEDVHQARVATRRLRSDLRTFRAYLPDDWALDIRAELGWLAEALGRARDADVLFERLHGQVGSLDQRDAEAAGALLGRLVAEQGDAREALLKVLDTDRYGALLDRLAAAAQELPPMKAPDDLGLVAVVPTAGEEAKEEARPAADPSAAGLPADGLPADGLPAAALSPVAAGLLADGLPAAALSPVTGGADQASGGAQMEGLTASGAAPVITPGAEAAAGDDAPPPGSGGEVASGPESGGGDDTQTAAPAAGHAGVETSIPDRGAPARQEAPAIVRGPWRHLSRAVHALGPAPSDEALHEVRIRAKRLRYASEAVSPAVGKPALELARTAADLQGVLGDFHDAIVAEDWLRTGTAGASPAQALAAGQLIARERDDAAQCRASWHDAWRRLNHKKRRAWLT
jgi:CHAD domain-containing protein